jgi:hypothetical protein
VAEITWEYVRSRGSRWGNLLEAGASKGKGRKITSFLVGEVHERGTLPLPKMRKVEWLAARSPTAPWGEASAVTPQENQTQTELASAFGFLSLSSESVMFLWREGDQETGVCSGVANKYSWGGLTLARCKCPHPQCSSFCHSGGIPSSSQEWQSRQTMSMVHS